MQTAPLLIVTAVGIWLVAISFLMAFSPRFGLQLFEKMILSLSNSNWRLQLLEQGSRIVAGTALIVRSPVSKLPSAFETAGWCIIVSSLVILVLPIRWHASYGRWCMKWLSPLMLRVLSPVPLVTGVGIAYAAF